MKLVLIFLSILSVTPLLFVGFIVGLDSKSAMIFLSLLPSIGVTYLIYAAIKGKDRII